ncbi:hypothetical protein [Pelobium manganitolerans]|uniref:hypothetical protein n=1 Tax=Pelobium manganitolerans TaxID=1842495 RepID=UPI003FA3B324
MKAVLTGDIIGSRTINAQIWLTRLKEVLDEYGEKPKNWNIYRGDSFQVITKAEDALRIAFLIKATIKMEKKLDVRMAIGLGDVDFEAPSINEANGEAFIYSGEQFDELKKNTLTIKSAFPDLDECLNQILNFAMLVANAWKPITAEVLYQALKHPELSQLQLASQLNKKSQSTISEALTRGGYEELVQLLGFYAKKIKFI